MATTQGAAHEKNKGSKSFAPMSGLFPWGHLLRVIQKLGGVSFGNALLGMCF